MEEEEAEILFLPRTGTAKDSSVQWESGYGDRELETGLIVVRDEVILPLDAADVAAEAPI